MAYCVCTNDLGKWLAEFLHLPATTKWFDIYFDVDSVTTVTCESYLHLDPDEEKELRTRLSRYMLVEIPDDPAKSDEGDEGE